MWGSYTAAEPMIEARDKLNIVSFLEEVRGTAEPNRQVLLDLLSGLLTHEEGVGRMYWQYTQQTGSPELRNEWQKFGKQTEAHRKVAEKVITVLGGDPMYKSQIARDHEKVMNCLTPVESQGYAGDHVRLSNLIMSENVSKLLWKSLHRLSINVKDPSMAKTLWDASHIALPTTEEHVNWNSAMYESYIDKLTLGM